MSLCTMRFEIGRLDDSGQSASSQRKKEVV